MRGACTTQRDPHPKGECWRGGGFDDAHQAFFTVGREYRVPAFLATSLSQKVPLGFLYRAVAAGRSGVLWCVRVDPRGETAFEHKCKNANYVANTHLPGKHN